MSTSPKRYRWRAWLWGVAGLLIVYFLLVAPHLGPRPSEEEPAEEPPASQPADTEGKQSHWTWVDGEWTEVPED